MSELIEVSRLIPASAEAIWSVISDLNRVREWAPIKAVLEFPNGMAAAPGVVVKVEQDTPMGRVALEQVFARCEPPTLLTWTNRGETLGGKPVTQIKDFGTEISLETMAEKQTKVTVRSRWTAVGLMGLVANNVIKPRLKREYDVSLQNIERLATSN